MRILFLGTDRELGLFRVEVLENEGHQVVFPKSRKEAVAAIAHGNFDVALVSYSLSNDTTEELVELIRQKCHLCPVVSISQNGWDDARISPDATVMADAGPRGMVEAIRSVQNKGLRRIK